MCMDDVDDSSSPGASSWGLETVGVVEGETNTEADVDGIVAVVTFEVFAAAKFLNMAKMESALDTLGRAGEPMRQRGGGRPIVRPLS